MNRKIAIFLGITVALIVYAYFFDYRKSAQQAEEKQREEQLLVLNKDQIQEVEIQKPDQKILMKRDTEGWRLIEPFQAPADNDAVELFVSTAASESYLEVAAEAKSGPPINWKLYGLDHPKAKITFRDSAGHAVSFEVSNEKNFEQNSFLRRDQEERVLVGTGTWFARAEKSAHELRDKRFFRPQIAAVRKIKISQGKKVLDLISKDGKWVSLDQPEQKLDQNKVREFLKNFSEVEVQNFLLEKSPTAAEEKKFFLDKPMAFISIDMAEKKWQASISRGTDKFYYVKIVEPPSVVRLNSDALGKVFQPEAQSFFEKTEKPKDKK